MPPEVAGGLLYTDPGAGHEHASRFNLAKLSNVHLAGVITNHLAKLTGFCV